MSDSTEEPILTLEPLIDAIRSAVEAAGWDLSGLQKTTSHQFEGRWEGESTRSAYLFFHRPEGPDFVSLDVYLDETSRGLTGNLALVADLRELGALGDAAEVLGVLARVSARELDASVRRPLSLRFRLADSDDPAEGAETEVRFKARLPGRVVRSGSSALSAWVEAVTGAFAVMLRSPELAVLAEEDELDEDESDGDEPGDD